MENDDAGKPETDWVKVADALVLTGHLSEAETPEWIVGQRVARLRAVRGMTQSQLATQLANHGYDMHQSTVAKLEAGKRPIRVNELVALARILGVAVHELVPDGDPVSQDKLAVAIRHLQEARARATMAEQNVHLSAQKAHEAQAQLSAAKEQALYEQTIVTEMETRIRELQQRGRG